MNVLHRRLIWALAGLIGALTPSLAAASDPFAIVDEALRLRKDMNDSELNAFIYKQALAEGTADANGFLLIAELLEQVGDYKAEHYFELAISHANEDAAYELFYADYLRNFRGPKRPLFKEAQEHYFAALEKLGRQRSPLPWSAAVREHVLRGLVVLYQEDGIPLAWRNDTGPQAPFLFFSSTARTAKSTADLDEIHDVRDLTAEALFSESALRLNRPLTREELRGLIRRKESNVLRERLRYRVESAAIDLFYEGRSIQNAQVTDFRQPDVFNRVRVDKLGTNFAFVFNEAPDFDGYFRQAFRLANRQGLIEAQPQAEERIFEGETTFGFSHFSGSNKNDFELTYVGQDIKPQIANPPRRWRNIFSARLDHQILRPLLWFRNPFGNRFATRGLDLFGGLADDQERFGDVIVRRDDAFVGISLNGLGPIDVTLQPTIFKQQVSGDRSQKSAQLRLDGTLVLRLLDEEAHPGIPRSFLGLHPAFVHLVIPVKRDQALEGLSAFENDRVGIGIDTKLFVMSFDDSTPTNARFGATTLLVSCRYYRERFLRLDKKMNLIELNLSLGF
ncbi:MAG TPA: hypothetical protein VGM86_34980 [Thermoanaerobaculia bacterium]|jgi:hypothetical protein